MNNSKTQLIKMLIFNKYFFIKLSFMKFFFFKKNSSRRKFKEKSFFLKKYLLDKFLQESHKFFLLLVWFFIQLSPLFSQELDEEEIRQRELELGLRIWVGYHSKDRFEDNLGNYRSNSGINISSYGSLSPFRKNNGIEFFTNYRLYKNWKAGLILGTGKFPSFEWNEYDTTNTFTKLNYSLSSDYLLISASYEWFFKKFSLEFGGGLGVNSTSLDSNGYSISTRREFYDIQGRLLAGGLSYRLQTNLNYKVKNNLFLQFGVAGTWHTAPYFAGSLNDKSSSLFLREDGTIGNLITSENTSNILATQSAVRRLDLFYGYLQIYVGSVIQINF